MLVKKICSKMENKMIYYDKPMSDKTVGEDRLKINIWFKNEKETIYYDIPMKRRKGKETQARSRH